MSTRKRSIQQLIEEQVKRWQINQSKKKEDKICPLQLNDSHKDIDLDID